jgi:uncharacterized membrane protein
MPDNFYTPKLKSPNSPIDLRRVIGISDAVFAFSLTLLVLEIRVPAGLGSMELFQYLTGLGPRMVIYLISFLVIGLAWDGHQRIMHLVQRGDGILVWSNMVVLLFVTFLPATSALLGQYPHEPLAVACLAANGCLINLAQGLSWNHASRNHTLVDPNLSLEIIRMVNRISLGSILIYGISIGIAFISIPAVFAAWMVVLAISYLLPRWTLQKAAAKAPSRKMHHNR